MFGNVCDADFIPLICCLLTIKVICMLMIWESKQLRYICSNSEGKVKDFLFGDPGVVSGEAGEGMSLVSGPCYDLP